MYRGVKWLLYLLAIILLLFLIVDCIFLSAPGWPQLLHILAIGLLLLLCLIWLWQRRLLITLSRVAYEDPLCRCPNLRRFTQHAQRYVNRHPLQPLLMAKLDVDRFKLINQTHGRAYGDRMLIALSRALEQCVPPGCFGRAHDDIFYFLLPYRNVRELHTLQARFLEQLDAQLGGAPHRFRLIMGHYYMTAADCTDAAQAIERANIAHRQAKARHLDVYVYDEALIQRELYRKEVEDRMGDALAGGEFQVYLQAQYALADEQAHSAEALVRWQTADGTLLPPSEFIPIFEENGFVTQIDLYVFEQVCAAMRGWMDAARAPISVAVNFSRRHLENPSFVHTLCAIADRYRVPHRLLGVEITETAFLESEVMLSTLLDELHERGFLLSMDDFGSGYSSLALLKNLPVDILKLDRSFFTDNRHKTRARLLIESVMQMAKRLEMVTVAEGVEDAEQVAFLREVGCDMVQGYYYARPVPLAQFWETNRIAPSDAKQPYHFDFDLLGDIKSGRGALGEEIPISLHRMFQFTMCEVLTRHYGEGEMAQLFRECGVLSGRAFARENLTLTLPLPAFLLNLRVQLIASRIGVLEVEEQSEDGSHFVFAVRNSLDCAGAQDLQKNMGQYDEGFFSGILSAYTGCDYSVTEVDCWTRGAKLCRFEVHLR